jgi:hypothetical protein
MELSSKIALLLIATKYEAKVLARLLARSNPIPSETEDLSLIKWWILRFVSNLQKLKDDVKVVTEM